MDVNKMLQDLRTELAQLDEALMAVERIAAGRGKRRGRPPSWIKAAQGMPAQASVAKPAKRRVTNIRYGRKKEENKLPVEQAS